MKTNLTKKVLFIIAGILLLGTLFSSCGKGTEPGPSGNENTHKISDFEVTIISHGQDGPGEDYDVIATVKNISNKDYGGFDHSLKCTVKDTNGALYQDKRSVLEIDAGATTPRNVYIDLPAGKVANPSTFTYEIVEDY